MIGRSKVPVRDDVQQDLKYVIDWEHNIGESPMRSLVMSRCATKLEMVLVKDVDWKRKVSVRAR